MRDIAADYGRAAELLRDTGVKKRAWVMVLFCMIHGDIPYREALSIWAEVAYDGWWGPERWHSEMCYDLLKIGIEQQPGEFLAALLRE